MTIHCKYDDLVDPFCLKHHEKNRNIHSQEQIDRLAKIIEFQGCRAPIIVSNLSKSIVKGHGTLAALKKLKWEKVPVVYQDFPNSDAEYLFVQSDNAIAAWSELDLAKINLDLAEIGPFDIELLGLKDFQIEPLDKLGSGEESLYTTKIDSPIYTPSGVKPKLSDLCDTKKYDELILEINSSYLPEKEKEFLRLAALRHIVFNYENIANFYAHSEEDTQKLMENSALVIIDYNKAIEKGFVKVTKDLAELYE